MGGFLTGRTSLTTVQTGDIADDAVSLGKLAAGTDGELLTWDASGNPAAVAVGTATHVLTSNGAGAAPTFQAASGGAWTLIGTSVASNSASLTVTGLPTDGTYDYYAIGISDLVPATDAVQIYFRLGDSSGIDSSASDYDWQITGGNSNASSAVAMGDTASSFLPLTNSDSASCGSSTGESSGAMLFLTTPGDTGKYPHVHGSLHYNGNNLYSHAAHMAGSRLANIAVDRCQVIMSSGLVESGRLTVWGISHA